MKTGYLAIVGLAGLALGFFAADLTQQDGSYCGTIEQDLKENRSFNGSIACYPPGVLDANISDRVAEGADHRCTCRIIDRSGIRLFPIAVSN